MNCSALPPKERILGVRFNGAAIDGPLRGQRLTRVAVHSAFWFGWYGFFPDPMIWRPSR